MKREADGKHLVPLHRSMLSAMCWRNRLSNRLIVVLLVSLQESFSSPCTRCNASDYVEETVQYSSIIGLLDIRLVYKAGFGSDGNMQHCYLTQDGIESPTLLVRPGDRLRLNLTNLVDVLAYAGLGKAAATASYGTNIHFHGMEVSPQPGQDFAVTIIAPGETFIYQVDISKDHTLGLHW